MRPLRTSIWLLAPLWLALGGCSGPEMKDVRLISGTARRDGNLYAVTAVIENGSRERLVLDDVSIEVAGFGASGRPVGDPKLFGFGGIVEAGRTSRLPLYRSDQRREIRSSRLILKDASGRTISTIDVAPIAAEAERTGTAEDAEDSRRTQRSGSGSQAPREG